MEIPALHQPTRTTKAIRDLRIAHCVGIRSRILRTTSFGDWTVCRRNGLEIPAYTNLQNYKDYRPP